MAFCTQCGHQMPDGARFCPACGAPASGAAPPVEPVVAPATLTPPESDSFARPAPAPTSYEDPKRGGGMTALGILAVIAVIVVAVVLWQQRDGARPVAGNESDPVTVTKDGDGEAAPVERPTDVAAAPTGGDDEPTSITEGGIAPETSDGGGAGTTDTIASAPGEGGSGVIPAAVIDTAFWSDRDAAAERFAGPVSVRGEIVSVSQVGDTRSVGMAGRSRFNTIIVNFAPDQRAAVEQLSRGQVITVACSDTTSLGGTTILRNCRY